MTRRSQAPFVAAAALIVAAALPSGPALASVREEQRPSSAAAGSSWIVMLDRTAGSDRAGRATVARTVTALASKLRFRPTAVYERAIPGFAAMLDAAQVAALRADPRVRYVQRDRPLELAAQLESASIRRVNTLLAPATHIDEVDLPEDRIDADIAILDTGVDAGHPDLNVVGGIDCTVHPGANGTPIGNPAYGDINGHGTHVAGIAAAIDNGSGVVGVAPGARIWSVRIFSADIQGWESNLLCGIEWVTDQRVDAGARPRMEVANMSMRIRTDDEGQPVGDDGDCGHTNQDPVHSAICESVAAGNVYAVAAGNERNDASVYIPASYDEVITVSALADFDGKPGGLAQSPLDCHSNANGVKDVDDTFADFSTHGADVDLIAPGVCVSSTYRGGGYKTLSGTSMATPAVAGGVALYRAMLPDAGPAQVRAGLIAAGTHDWATQTDPDGMPERLLDVRSAGAPAEFQLVVRPSIRGNPAGGTCTYDVEVSRGFAFTDALALSLDASALPAGVTAELSTTHLPEVDDVASVLTVMVPEGTPDGPASMTVTASGGAEPIEHAATADLIIDNVAPDVTDPLVEFITGSVPAPGTIPLRVTWSGSDASGTHWYVVGRHLDNGRWTTIASLGPTATGVTNAVEPDRDVRFRVQATDLAANTTIAYGPTLKLRRRPESAHSISYSSGWVIQSVSGAYGGSLRHANATGAQAVITFTGRAFAWLSPMSAGRGSAEVYVDDVLVATVDLHDPTPLISRVVYATTWPTSELHTVRIRAVGTPGHARIDLDEVFTLR